MSDPLILTFHEGSLLDSAVDAIVIAVPQDGELQGSARELDRRLSGLLEDMRWRKEISGEVGQTAVVPLPSPEGGEKRPLRAILVGLSKRAECTPEAVRRAAAAAARAAGKRGLFVLAADPADVPLDAESAATALAEGTVLAEYVPDPYRTGERRDTRVRELQLVGTGLETAARNGAIRGGAKNFARDLVNEPSNVLDPPELARRAAAMAAEVGLECEILEAAEMERLGMGAVLTVSRGSETPPRFIVLRHRGAGGGSNGAGRPQLALLGKAVTFDTGGISIKPSADMGKMKGDMAGGAAVIGAMRAIAELGVPVDVIGLVPAVDNMPSGRAWKPGDVVTTMSGKTVETVTTDAEGRMILADALCYARQLGAARMVDIATLTGACAIALGNVASGLYGNDPELIEAVRACGEEAGERHWPMPLFPEYREQIRGDIADLKNSGGRLAGSVTAAWFLREFADDVPWAHLDVAGTAQVDKSRPWAPAGPTGTGVGTFINLADRIARG